MTNEEAVKELKALLNMCDPSPLTKELEDALKMAIKALEQQPSEDTVSRTEAIDKLTKFYNMVLDDNGTKLNIRDIVGTLERLPSVTPSYNSVKTELKPSVTPERPKGKWIEVFVETPNDPYSYGFKSHKCSKCEYSPLQISNYCPNCGADMSGGVEE